MTRDEVKADLKKRDIKWLESRWSVLSEAINVFEKHLDEIESAFEHDYLDQSAETTHPLEHFVIRDKGEIWSKIVNRSRAEIDDGAICWKELIVIIDDQIELLQKAKKCPACTGRGFFWPQMKILDKREICQRCSGTGSNVHRPAEVEFIKQGGVLVIEGNACTGVGRKVSLPKPQPQVPVEQI